MPIDLILGVPGQENTKRTYDHYVQEMCEQIENSYEMARTHLQVSAEVRKKHYDIRVLRF